MNLVSSIDKEIQLMILGYSLICHLLREAAAAMMLHAWMRLFGEGGTRPEPEVCGTQALWEGAVGGRGGRAWAKLQYLSLSRSCSLKPRGI